MPGTHYSNGDVRSHVATLPAQLEQIVKRAALEELLGTIIGGGDVPVASTVGARATRGGPAQ